MKCLACQKEILSSSHFCNFCGQEISHNFSLHPIPEGFVFDNISGWYHKIELKRDKKGKLTQEVTYFNPEKNWFLTELPPDHPSYKVSKTENEGSPIGKVGDYQFDEIQQFYYLTDVHENPKTGETIQRVSYYNPKDKVFTNINYLILDINPKMPAKPINIYVLPQTEEDDAGDKKRRAKEKRKKESKEKKKKKTPRTIFLRILSLFLGLLAVLLGIYYGLVWLGVVPAGKLEASISNFSASIQAFPRKISDLFVKKRVTWPEFPHVSSLYKKAFQEGDFLYFLGTTESQSAALYRFDTKSGENEIIVESPDGVNLLAAFTITPKHIYYSLAKENDSEAKYYRLQKETGEFQYLFQADNSSLVAADDSVYIILSANNKLRKISEKTDNPNDYIEIEIPPTTDNSYVLSNNFSIVDDDLYYSERKDKNFVYYRYNLVTKSKESLLKSATDTAIIINPYWIDGRANYTRIDEESQTISLLQDSGEGKILAQYAVDLQEDPARYFAVKADNQVIYATKQGTMVMDLNQQTGTRISTSAPIAISKNWIVLENSVFSLLDGSLHYVASNGHLPAGKEAALGHSDSDSSPVSSPMDESADEKRITIHNEIFEIAALMAVNNPYDELSGKELVSRMSMLFANISDKSSFLDNGMLNILAMSDLLWELFSVDYSYFSEIVHSELVDGFITRSDGIQYDSEKSHDLEGVTIQSVEKIEDEDTLAMRVTVFTTNGTEEYVVYYEENEMYSISQYKLVGTKRMVDKNQ